MKKLANLAPIAMAALLMVTLGPAIQAQETEVEIRRGEVLRVVGNTLLVRVEGEGVKRYTVPSDFRFNHEGDEITVRELREGMILTGVRLRTTGAADVEDIETAMAEIAEAPAEMAEDGDDESGDTESAEAESAEESAESPAAAAESAGAPAAPTAAEATSDEGVASAEEAVGMSPALMVGLVLLVLILIVFAAKGLGSSGKKTGK